MYGKIHHWRRSTFAWRGRNTAGEELGITSFKPQFLVKYIFESEREKELIYVYRTTYDGEILPSVSELCRFISKEMYSDVPQATLERAAERGTNVHKLTEALDKYGECEADDTLIPYIEAYVSFLKKHKCEWRFIEKSMHNPKLMYAGTIDRLGLIDGEVSILDIKTTSQIHQVSVAAQLTLYKRMAEENGYGITKLYVLQLKKDGKFTLRNVDPDEPLADACLTLHDRLKPKKRKNK